ncbi:MAG: hypothetical protein ACYTBJ_13150, partial [Planctomycetota bacterium]
MYRKLMFLISLVMLLGLVNVAKADIDWIGDGGSFCDPCNWDGGVVPVTPERAWIDCDNGSGDIVIDCDVHVDRMRGPAQEGDCNQNMDIVSGNILIDDSWRAIYEGDKVGIVTATSGTLTVDNGGSSTRLTDDGGDGTYGHYYFEGDFLMNLGGRLRSGDNGGNIFL